MATQSLGIIIIDDYQNKIISGQEVSMLIDGERPRLTGRNQQHIFLAPISGIHNLSVAGIQFQKQDMEIDADEETQIGRGVMKIRLQPNRHYPLDKGATVLQGRADSGGELHFVFIGQKEAYQLEKDYRVGEKEISLGHRGATETFLDGTLFCLQKKDGQIEEFWIEESAGEPGRYRLRYTLNTAYEKGKCILRRVYAVMAEEEGYFYLPVPAEAVGSEEYRYYSPLDKQTIKTGTLIEPS